ncbi:hypothetical protein [Yoonia maritima]|uniref:hypothetical protein n=1 Tax=Yoonia maritima TaxID=1435347 RepID=UPI0013A60391|nr:hypothetical protein [Yoonia maritima]
MRYLNQKSRVEEMFRKFATVTGAALEEVQEGNGIDPKTLMARCYSGSLSDISDELRSKLRGGRTPSGARCQSPRQPPPHIDPSHRKGELCSMYRCVLCSEGLFFPNEAGAYEAILARAWRLYDLKKTISPQEWIGTDADHEMNAIIALAYSFYPNLIAAFPTLD